MKCFHIRNFSYIKRAGWDAILISKSYPWDKRFAPWLCTILQSEGSAYLNCIAFFESMFLNKTLYLKMYVSRSKSHLLTQFC
ncbi:hypothetical protein L1987_37307 [Smallanthus sonchifolius]|uniref:Uncharacterized protein n=1 Tax=Smallanthus sonchifolius TaxID=185202 RepID=A0ACB9HG13_9ASTR|nr:hypothetical protein L1987_37307 [Smallanthus sonchifolius]